MWNNLADSDQNGVNLGTSDLKNLDGFAAGKLLGCAGKGNSSSNFKV